MIEKLFTRCSRIFASVLLAFCALFAGCEKDTNCLDATNPECPNYDSCQTVEDLSADFETFIYTRSAPPFSGTEYIEQYLVIPGTTIPGALSFRALDETGDSYEWSFGSDPRTNYGQETKLFFSLGTVEGQVDINLTVYRDTEECPERGNEVVTNTESLYIIGENADFDTKPILGTFLGNNESESEQPDFSITFFEDDDAIRLKGFPRGAVNGEVLNNPFLVCNYKGFILTPSDNSCCSGAYGVGQLSDDKQDLESSTKFLTLIQKNGLKRFG